LADAGVAKDTNPDHAIFASCTALLFFGVPNQGLNNQNLLSLVREQNNARLVQDLDINSPLLEIIHQNFTRVVEKIGFCRVVSFYEALDSNSIEVCFSGVSIVVSM
jgi:hypothetical protein